MDNVVLASIYRLTATNFRMSAEILFREFQKRGEAMPRNVRAIPFYYLISHAIELLLKCALLKRGESADSLKKYPMAHSLNTLLQNLKDMNVSVSNTASDIINELGRQHEKHSLRYTALIDDGEMTFTPDPLAIFEILDELLLAGRISAHEN